MRRWLAVVLIAATGCRAVSLKRVDDGGFRDTVRGVLRLNAPGPAASADLQSAGVPVGYPFDADAAVAKFADAVTTADGLATLAEVCDLAGRDAEAFRPARAAGHYLNAAYYADRAIADTGLTPERAADVHRLYNRGCEKFLKLSSGRRFRPDDAWCRACSDRGWRVTVRRDGHAWEPEPFDEFKFAGDYAVIGRTPNRSDGVGVPLFAVKKRGWRDPDRLTGPDRFFPALQVYPATAHLRFEADPAGGSPVVVVELLDPLRYHAVEVGGTTRPLASDLTTPLVYHYTQSDLDTVTQFGMFDPQREAHKSGLYLSHPYERGKIPVVLIHGLWSSPETWLPAIDALRADPEIRRRYQFMTFMYTTGTPFLHSAALLRKGLADLRREVDPDGTDAAFDKMVVVGHSMGGLIAKTLVQSSGDELWRIISPRPFDELLADDTQRETFRDVFFFGPVPSVKRVVYIAVPHRGSWVGNNWLGQIGDWLIRRPNVMLDAHKAVVARNGDGFFVRTFAAGVPSSIQLLRYHNPTILTVDGLPVANGVVEHSVIAQVAPGPRQMGTDGVVTYDSSHRTSAVSEHVVIGHHVCTEKDEVIAEVRRVLYEHAGLK